MIRSLRAAVIVGVVASGISGSGFAQSGTGMESTGAPTQAGLTSAAAVAPDQQASKEQIAKLFEVMRVKQQMDSMMKMMPAMIQQQMKTQMDAMRAKLPNGKQMPADEQAALDELMKKQVDRAMNIVSLDDILIDLTDVYQRHISKSDADAFIAFYSSEAGQHLLDAQPVIMKEYMPKMMAHLNEKTQELTDEMIRDIAELTKKYEQRPTKTAASKQ